MKDRDLSATVANVIIAVFFTTLFVMIFFFPREFGRLLNNIIEQIK